MVRKLSDAGGDAGRVWVGCGSSLRGKKIDLRKISIYKV